MKPGDLVRQAPNIFADREVGGKKMLVLRVEEQKPGSTETVVVTLLDGEERKWNYNALEVVREAR